MSDRVVRHAFAGAATRILHAVSKPNVSRAFLIDLGIVVGMASTHALSLSFTPPPWGPWGWPLMMSVPALCTLLVRRQLPWVGLVVLLATTIALIYPDIDIGPLNLAILVSVYSVTSVRGPVGSIAAGIVAMTYPVARLLFFEWPFGEGVLMIIGALVNLILVIGWGWSIREGKQRSAQLEQTVALLDEARDQLAADAAAIERARIAREFHDIVSHNLAVVVLRAGVARALVDREPEHARETLVELERSSRSALGEMRNLLGALREGRDEVSEAEPAPEAEDELRRRPAPTLERLDALVDSVRGSGMEWKVERRGQVRELGQGVEMTAYRIVQEAVTNVLKHAGFGRARVVLDYGDSTLGVEITNTLSGPEIEPLAPRRGQGVPVSAAAQAYPSSGHGLIGLRERVAVLGGTLTAHPVPNGFHLAAVLPCPEYSDSA
ncbi:sensor histidine kinase [Allosaccharopolyspora coralli]|uniref:histidine kinase n=1 Tax=Allosaccharopolyspora coralli TaxID=2665642 RepID=A0A5Q3Q5D9_9PSEU|nr:sensor histidine kinase [Allosaccharopolyspora coralli]